MSAVDPRAIRVLITGFGPFSKYTVNPSWLAVAPLHNTVLYADPPADPVTQADMMEVTPTTPIPIHITTLLIPVSYTAVLAVVPGLHARPPVFPHIDDPAFAIPPPPPNGYDFIFHVGVAGRGALRMEKLAHKLNYRMKDADGQYAPVVNLPKEAPGEGEPSEQERIELEVYLLANLPVSAIHHHQTGEGHADGVEHPPIRGFAKGYENFPDELNTDIDVPRLIHHIKETGIDQIYSSMDAGHFICDFCFYCSLAEARRAAGKQEKGKERGSPIRSTPVLFMHCPPVDLPLSTEEVTEAIKRITVWVCTCQSTAPIS